VKLATAAEAQKNLGLPLLEVELERHEREPLLLGPHSKLADLAAVHEQLALAARLMIELVGLHVFWNITADEPDLASLDLGIGFFERDLAVAQALYLAPHQHDAALERIEHFVFVPSASVLGHQPLIVVLAVRRLFLIALGRGKTPFRLRGQPFAKLLRLLE